MEWSISENDKYKKENIFRREQQKLILISNGAVRARLVARQTKGTCEKLNYTKI